MPAAEQAARRELEDKVVVISGAGGVCAHLIARTILSSGGMVVLLDAPGRALERNYDALADEFGLDEHSARLAIYPLDPAAPRPGDYEKLTTALSEACPGIDAVIHNTAALCPPQGLEELSVQDWYRVFQVNVHAPWLTQRALLGLMRKRQGSRIVFIVDELDEPWLGAYALSRTAQIHLMRAWASEIKPGRAVAGPAITGLSVTGLATEAQQYYFPGLAPETVPGLDSLPELLRYALTGAPETVHGQVLSCAPPESGSGSQ